jgi:hypothetical protein
MQYMHHVTIEPERKLSVEKPAWREKDGKNAKQIELGHIHFL